MRINKDYMNKYLKVYAKIQIYTVLILLAIPIVMYILNPQAYIYEVDYNDCEGAYCMQETDLALISIEEARKMKHKIRFYAVVGSVCLLGMMFSNPDSRKNMKKICDSITKGEKNE